MQVVQADWTLPDSADWEAMFRGDLEEAAVALAVVPAVVEVASVVGEAVAADGAAAVGLEAVGVVGAARGARTAEGDSSARL